MTPIWVTPIEPGVRTSVKVDVIQVEALPLRVLDVTKEVALRRTALGAAAAGGPAGCVFEESIHHLCSGARADERRRE